MIDEKVRKLVSYIVENSEGESAFLTASPQHCLSTEGLVDKICEVFDIEQKEMGEFIDTTQKKTPEAECEGCGYKGAADTFPPCISPYHDLKCPKCGTTQIDTSDLKDAWAKDGLKYGYGDRNVMVTGD